PEWESSFQRMGGILGTAGNYSECNSDDPSAESSRQYSLDVGSQHQQCIDRARRICRYRWSARIRTLCICDVRAGTLLRAGMLASSWLHPRRRGGSTNSGARTIRKIRRSSPQVREHRRLQENAPRRLWI